MGKTNQIKKYMGTLIEISINSPEKSQNELNAIIQKAFKQFEYVVKKYSRFCPTSELSYLNRTHEQYTKVSNELFNLIKFSKQVAKETNYAFDPTIIDLLKAFGYDTDYDPKRISEKLAQADKLIQQVEEIKKHRKNIKNVKMNDENKTIYLPKGVQIDLGASAKGLAIDLATKILRKNHITNFIINAGGDIFVGGEKTIALFNPQNPDKFKKIKLKNKAIAGSGKSAKQLGIFSHILNPKNSPTSFQQVYVIADKAIIADIYSTALFLSGKNGIKLLRKKGLKFIIYQ